MDYTNISLSYLYEYVHLCSTLSLTETAKNFYVSQSTLSRHMSELEKRLGNSLMTRTTHGIELTAAGQAAFLEFKKMTDAYSELHLQLADISSGKSGKLTVASLYYGMEDFVERYIDPYMRDYPGVELSLLSMQSNQILQAVDQEECDLGYAMYTEEMDPEKYAFVTTSEERLNIITREEMDLSEQSIEQVLSTYTMINVVRDRYYMNMIQKLMKKKNIEIRGFEDVEQVDLIPRALKKRKSIFIGPESMQGMTKQKVYFYPIEDDGYTIKMGFYHRKNNENPCVQNFVSKIPLRKQD